MVIRIYLLICLLVCSVFSWDFIGPGDSTGIKNLYTFGSGHILAFVGKTDDGNSLLLRSKDYGDTWDSITNTGLPRISTVDSQIFFYNNKLLVGPGSGASNDGIFFSVDSGNTWVKDSMIICGGGMAYSFASKDSLLLAGTYCDFARSTDWGSTWQNHIEIPDLQNDIGAVLCMMEFRDVVYAGTQYGIFASKDWGLTWEKRGKNFTGPGGTIFVLSRIDTVFIMTNKAGAYTCYDLGQNEQSWNFTFITDGSTHHLVVDSSQIYISVYNSNEWHYYHSIDTGKTYQPFTIQNPESYFYNFASDDKYIYVMNKKGIYRNLKTDDPTEKHWTQKVNTKNTNSTIINGRLHFKILQKGLVTVDLYNLNGKKIGSLFKGNVPEGKMVVPLNMRMLAGGCYVVCVRKGDGDVYLRYVVR